MTNHHAEGPSGPLDSAADAAKLARVKSAVQAMDAVPRQIGPYRILHTLGEGGMGVVYLAEQTQPIHRQVAIKIVKLGMDTKQVIARFETEREALALMNHPHVARVIDAGATETGRPYFVMEYVPGVPISRYCDEKRLRTEQRLQLFSDVCAAVQHAHQKGIIHRDIKPSNVLVMEIDGKPVVKVIDFGIAKATQQRLSEETYFTATGNIVGTPAYMSPEQAGAAPGGAVADIDTRTDVYSLGVLLYELLVGALPFDPAIMRQAAFSEIQRIIREVDPPKPSTRLLALRAEPRASARANVPDSTEPRANQSPVAVQARARVPVATETQSPANRIADSTTTEVLPSHGEIARAKARGSDLGTIAAMRSTPPTTLLKQLRGDLDWIVMKCLEKDRARRYETVNALVMEIGRYLNHEPVSAGPPSAAYRLKKFVRRNRVAVAAGSAVVLALSIGLVGTYSMYARAEQERVRAESALAGEAEQRRVAAQRETDAREARAEAEQREKETAQVAEFQASQLSELDPEMMGVRLRRDILDKRREVLAGRGTEPEAIEAALTEAEATLAGVNFTNVALRTLDENIFQRALVALEKDLDDQPLVKARLLQTVADTLLKLGLLDRATAPLTGALETRRRVLGDDHPDTLYSVSNLGVLLLEQGKRDEALPYLREALEGQRSVLGDDHLHTLISIGNMGSLLSEVGKLDEAMPYYREELEVRRRTLGDDHPDTLNSISNLGALLYMQGKLEESMLFYREAVDGRRRVLGDDHLHTLISIGNMGSLMFKQGKLDQALEYFHQALEKKRRVLGDEHPSTLDTIAFLGGLLEAQGKQDQAMPYYREALETRRRVLGDDHPNTLSSVNNMGALLQAQGKLDEAMPYYRDALEVRRRTLGDNHPDTLISFACIGHLLRSQGKLDEAIPYYVESLEGFRRVLGNNHPDTLTSINNMGFLLEAQGKLNEAISYYHEALTTRSNVLGDDHPDTLASVRNMGSLLNKLGRENEAASLLQASEAAARRVWTGGNSRWLGVYLANLGGARAAQGAFAEAESRLLEAHILLAAGFGVDHERSRPCVHHFVALYDSWHVAEPDQGYEVEAAKWRAKLDELTTDAETPKGTEAPTDKEKSSGDPVEKKNDQSPAQSP